MSLHIPSFGGGIVRTGSPDAQRTDELLEADSLDIGPRGQLVATSDASDYYTLKDLQGVPVAWSKLHGLGSITLVGSPYIFAVGEGSDVTPTLRYICAFLERVGAAIPLAVGRVFEFRAPAPVPNGLGVLVTTEQFPGSFDDSVTRRNVFCVCAGAREGAYPNTAPGLWFYAAIVGFTAGAFSPSTVYDCLGTGTARGGTKGKQLYFRGIVAYNNFIFGWGYDSADTVNFDGPNRVMFCNAGTPLKWGNDNASVAADRDFTDSDAIVLGDAGEIIRGALKWRTRLYFGTNQQLHYIAGFGRNSFVTDGANPVAKSYNIVGPHALIEGPDTLMYGVSEQGLWSYDGAKFLPIFQRLVDFAGHSTGYWDCIWTDPTAAAGFPGRTNQDLVWTAVDWDREQVVVGIPYCNATTGAGAGIDTVVLKYHPRTGGFTRQVFLGVAYTAASYVRREGQQRETRVLGTSTAATPTLKRYAHQATPTTAPIMPTRLPRATCGPYAPFGPDGAGVVRRAYLTVAWEAVASLPIVFTGSTTLDGAANDSFTLTIAAAAPGAPAAGDLWLDTSQTDTSLGNATAGTMVAAAGGYLLKTWTGSAWRMVPGSGGKGTRATIPLPLTRRTAGRVTLTVACTSAAGRFQLEGLGINPGGGSDNA